MFRKEVNECSPMRILERSIHGGLGNGNLGVVMARAGVGKTTFLVRMALDDAMRERGVLHVALGQPLEHVQGWYDALFEDIAESNHLEDPQAVRALVNRHRIIQAVAGRSLSAEHLEKIVNLYVENVSFEPEVLVIDGYDWDGPVATRAAELGAFKALAKRLGVELWMAAQTHREQTSDHPTGLTPPCEAYGELIDVAIFLEPHENHVQVRLLKDHQEAAAADTHLELDPDTMRICSEQPRNGVRLHPSAYVLLSGGAPGAEAFFGATAERWGVGEVNFSFPGRTMERSVAVVELTESELRRGDVSSTYIEQHLHRKFPKTETFQKMLQTIWHQVATAGEVFVVGMIQDDNTVRGGTGWAAELARHFHKPVHVFDQERKRWHSWDGNQWAEVEAPQIRRKRFAGTGTRFLSDAGREAIEKLFQDSFGQAK